MRKIKEMIGVCLLIGIATICICACGEDDPPKQNGPDFALIQQCLADGLLTSDDIKDIAYRWHGNKECVDGKLVETDYLPKTAFGSELTDEEKGKIEKEYKEYAKKNLSYDSENELEINCFGTYNGYAVVHISEVGVSYLQISSTTKIGDVQFLFPNSNNLLFAWRRQ